MKIIVLGGAGDVGSRAVEELAAADGVQRVTIADRNIQAAERVAARCVDMPARVEVCAVDANDHRQLVASLAGHDVAASALGPFHRFESKLVRAAIDAGVHYASVCDEWQAAEAVFTEFDEPARQRGCIVVTGLGTSPGMSNMAVRYLIDGLDRPRRADIYCFQPLNAGGGEAVLRHMLFIITGDVRVWRNGQVVHVPACSEERLVRFPQFGELRVWNMGHSEPVTLPRFLPELEEANFYMGFGRGARLLIWPARRGWFGRPWLANGFVRACVLIERLFAGRPPAPGALRVDVWGERNGCQVQRTLCGVGTMREATGVSLAVGVLMLARGELCQTAGGVYAPEGCLDPRLFLEKLRGKGMSAYHDLEMTQTVT